MPNMQYDQAANGVLHQPEARQWSPQADGEMQAMPEEGCGRQETQRQRAVHAIRPKSGCDEARAKPAHDRGAAMEVPRASGMGQGASAANVSSPGQVPCARRNGVATMGRLGAPQLDYTQPAPQAADAQISAASVEDVERERAYGESLTPGTATTRGNEPMGAHDEHKDAEPHPASKSAVATTSELLELVRNQGYRCALTGRELTPDNCAVDHINPICSGRVDHSIRNLQIITRQANRAKGMLANEEFIGLCRDVVRHTSRPR